MIALALDAATAIAAVVAAGFAAAAVLALWMVHSVARKLLAVAICAVLAFAVWTQRTALEDCADKVATNLELADLVEIDAPSDAPELPSVDTTCSLFGVSVEIPTS